MSSFTSTTPSLETKAHGSPAVVVKEMDKDGAFGVAGAHHEATAEELAITSQMDFIVPLKQIGLITRAVLEAIHAYHTPRRILVITSASEGRLLRALTPYWNMGEVVCVDEESFFESNFGLSLQDIVAQYDTQREGDQREPGWWVQQLIKLGAATQIQGISSVYVVWDGDLVPTRRWRLCERDALTGQVRYFIAILQGEARSVFNSTQYASCMKYVCDFEPLEPENGGTFVAHHMVFHTRYVNEMLELFASNVKLHKQKEQEQLSSQISSSSSSSSTPWPLLIMALSRTFYRFSEYKTYATFMLKQHPHEFHYHEFDLFGQGGLRFREANDVCEKMLAACPLQDGGLSYSQVVQFVHQSLIAGNSSGERQGATTAHTSIPGYVQLDHVYGLEGIDLNMTASSSPIDDLSHSRWQDEEEEDEEDEEEEVEDTRSIRSFSSISEDMRDDDVDVATTSSSFSSTSSILCSLHKSFQFPANAVDVTSSKATPFSSSSALLTVDGVHAASRRGGRELHESYCYSDDDEESLTSNEEDSLSSSPPSSCSPYDLHLGVCSPIAKTATATTTPSSTTTTTSNAIPPRSLLSSLLKERQRLLTEQEGEW